MDTAHTGTLLLSSHAVPSLAQVLTKGPKSVLLPAAPHPEGCTAAPYHLAPAYSTSAPPTDPKRPLGRFRMQRAAAKARSTCAGTRSTVPLRCGPLPACPHSGLMHAAVEASTKKSPQSVGQYRTPRSLLRGAQRAGPATRVEGLQLFAATGAGAHCHVGAGHTLEARLWATTQQYTPHNAPHSPHYGT